MIGLADLAAGYLDLVNAPFTFPGSRILVLRSGPAVSVRLAEYERPLKDCVLVHELRVLDQSGRVLNVSGVWPDRIEFGTVTLTFDGPSALSVGPVRHRPVERWALELWLPGAVAGEIDRAANVATGSWTPGLASTAAAHWVATGVDHVVVHDDADGVSVVRFALSGGSAVRLAMDTVQTSPNHAAAGAATRAVWEDWFARCPAVRDDLVEMTAFCWWVLGANIITLAGRGDARVVVPSMIGYVGLWQWDAYFIAIGLRHGDPDLAREQLDLALRFASASGQLPDVVHDNGLLASSADLPAGDRETLRGAGSTIADSTAPIPLTKPPLTAWALRALEGRVDDPAWFDWAWAVIDRSQQWWFRDADLDGDGMPEYGHPYSSGMDDNPIFDGELPVASPDLAAYLILQDDLLAAHCRAAGDSAKAQRHTLRADATLALLETMWDEEAGFFRSYGAGRPVAGETAVSLIPLLTGRLPARIVTRMLDALDDPKRFASPFAVPTVAVRDPSFSAEQMWRGPVWINVNTLLADGLAVSGHSERSRELAESTLRLVIEGGGPHEYFHPLTGARAGGATTSFGWSAALFVDLAVGASASGPATT